MLSSLPILSAHYKISSNQSKCLLLRFVSLTCNKVASEVTWLISLRKEKTKITTNQDGLGWQVCGDDYPYKKDP